MGHHWIGFIIDMFKMDVETLEFDYKMLQLSDADYLVLGCAMIQSQWLRQLLAFGKFALLNQVMHLTASVCNIFCVQQYQSFAMKAFIILDQHKSIMMKILTQAVWTIMVVILHDYCSFCLTGISMSQYFFMLDTSWICIISSDKRMLTCCF